MSESTQQNRERNVFVLPPLDESAVIALRILEESKSTLTDSEKALVVAGFQECIKWLNDESTDAQEVIREAVELIESLRRDPAITYRLALNCAITPEENDQLESSIQKLKQLLK